MTLSASVVVAAAPPSPSAGPRSARSILAGCKPGHAVQATAYMRINGHDRTDIALHSGDWIRTGPRGAAQVCLQQGTVQCRIRPDSRIQVLPKHAPDVIMQAPPGRRVNVWCKANDTGKRKKIKVGGQTITLGALGLSQQPRFLAGRTAGGTGSYLFSLSVSGKKTVMKVRRGATVVAPRTSIHEGVVVGRDQQVVAKSDGAPGKPAPINLTPAEAAALDQLGRLLPKDKDTNAPTFVVTGPTTDSSLRSPLFKFASNETGTVFSCSLNAPNDFHVCADGQPFGHLAPGPNHIFVKATDPSGNTTKRATRFDWSIAQNPIVYARGPARGNTDIWMADSDGTGQRQLTDDSAHTRAPEWSPDHKRIVFDSDVGGNADIYVMSSTGGDRRKLTTDSAPNLNPTWSPDGKRIAFEVRLRDGTRDLYTMSSDGTDVRRLTSNLADDLDPSWSPDGTQIAFASTRGENYDIWVINAAGGQPTDLTNTPDDTEFGPSWSPDGKKIVFHRKGVRTPNDIIIMNPDGSNVQRITHSGWDDQNPAWAPDGREIVFQSSRVPGGADSDIYLVSLDTKLEMRLTTDADYDYLPDW